MQVNKRYLKKILALVITSIVFILNVVYFKNGFLFFVMNLIFVILSIVEFRYSVLSLFFVLVNYPLITLSFQEITGESYGLLELMSSIIPLHYYQINMTVFIVNLIIYFLAKQKKIELYESQMLDKGFKISKLSMYTFCLIAIAATVIYIPRLAIIGIYVGDRFYHLLPGDAWNYVAITAVIFSTCYNKITKIQMFTYIFVIGWFFANYERVDMLGLLVFLIFRYSKEFKNTAQKVVSKLSKYKKICLMIGLVTFLFGTTYIRDGKEFNFIDLTRDVFTQATASDVIYIYNSAFEYVENIGLENGKTYLNYIYKIVPFSGNENDYSRILSRYIHNAGGGYFLSEPYMNFGIVGVIIFPIVFCLFLSFCVKKIVFILM